MTVAGLPPPSLDELRRIDRNSVGLKLSSLAAVLERDLLADDGTEAIGALSMAAFVAADVRTTAIGHATRIAEMRTKLAEARRGLRDGDCGEASVAEAEEAVAALDRTAGTVETRLKDTTDGLADAAWAVRSALDRLSAADPRRAILEGVFAQLPSDPALR